MFVDDCDLNLPKKDARLEKALVGVWGTISERKTTIKIDYYSYKIGHN